MKKHKDFFWTLLAIAVIALLIFAVYQSKQSPTLELDLSDSAQTPEHALVAQALDDPERFTQVVESEDVASEQQIQLPFSEVAPSLVSSLSTTSETRSQRALDVDASSLAVATQRIYLSGASLRKDAFMNPSSSENLSVIRTLIRKRSESVE